MLLQALHNERKLAPQRTCTCAPPRTHLADDQALAAVRIVHRHVQPRAEQVLVVLRVDARADQRAVARQLALALAEAVGAQLAREPNLVVDGAVLREGLRSIAGARSASSSISANQVAAAGSLQCSAAPLPLAPGTASTGIGTRS